MIYLQLPPVFRKFLGKRRYFKTSNRENYDTYLSKRR